MKKMNLLAMSLVSAAALSFSSCSSNDDLTGGGTQSQADGVYMTLKISGATSHGTRTSVATPNTEENGTGDESTITEGTMYIYDENTCVFKKVITDEMFDTKPTQTTAGVTKPIKVAVTGAIKTNKAYHVYFLANNTTVSDPLAAEASFVASTTGGADYATAKKFVMFNQNDGTRQAAHSTVTFTDAAKSDAKPAHADEIKLDRVVARIDNPLFAETATVVDDAAAGTTKNVADVLASFTYMGYAASNLNNNSYVKQNWDTEFKTLSVKWGEAANKYYQPKSSFGTTYKGENLTVFDTRNTYAFENTTNDVNEATAVYFKIKANLTDAAKATADFKDGTFYRYDGRLYNSIKAIFDDAATGAIVNPFNLLTVDEVLAKIKDATGKLITEEKLAEFRETYKIEVYREGMMYYRWAISDNAYKPFVASATEHTYSVLRNSIYRLNVTKINEIGKDVPNGPDPDDPNKNPNYYMDVTVKINPWVLNTKDIELE
ncbi:Mfa1 family fimbria major subunit [Segatella copri]|uniref:Mfa1 family fimbria major subunit n=1 Tax=Segatella copri TaxID=165179 RepID=UPI003F96BEF0